MLFSTTKVATDERTIDELLTRGVAAVFPSTDALRGALKGGKQLSFYLGIDPTGPTLHLGHAIALKKLRDLQRAGHKITLLIGDFTATIGDPTGKSEARKQLTEADVLKNAQLYKKQAATFISFSGSNKAHIRHNSEWLKKMSFADVVRMASLVTVDQMMKRDMFVERSRRGLPVFVHELLYPLMQGYDSVALGVDGEVGGNDQTFNMLVGRDLVQHFHHKEKFVFALKLLEDASGKKMGKTEGNILALNDAPETMFGKIMSWTDGMIIPGFELCTDVDTPHIQNLANELASGKNPKEIKEKLAYEITKLYHGEKKALHAASEFTRVFGKKENPEDILTIKAPAGTTIRNLLVERGVVSSLSEFQRLVEQGAVSTGDTVIQDVHHVSGTTPEIYKIGKRRFVKFNPE